MAGAGPLSFLSLPEVAHDVVEVLPHQFLHPLQSAESLARNKILIFNFLRKNVLIVDWLVLEPLCWFYVILGMKYLINSYWLDNGSKGG